MRRYIFLLFVLLAVAAAPVANASSIVSTSDEHFISLGINAQGQALVKYKDDNGTVHQTVAYGAENAIAPKEGAVQVNFTYDYSGGYTLFKSDIAKATAQLRTDQALVQKAQTAAAAQGKKYTPDVTKASAAVKADYAAISKLHAQSNSFGDTGFACKPYTGPKLAFQVAACTAPDGSYWAVQQWQRQLPDYGVTPSAQQASNELHLSHWTGPLPILTVETDWSYHQWQHIFGTYTYDGGAVYGFKATAAGAPLDTFGRNVYVDSFNSDMGTGWARVNSFLTHTGDGVFCYGFSPHNGKTGAGTQYRMTVEGPGVVPDVSVVVASPGPFNASVDETQNAKITALSDKQCKAN